MTEGFADEGEVQENIAVEIESYFQSIEDSFDPSFRAVSDNDSGAAMGVALVATAFSVLPLLPAIAWTILHFCLHREAFFKGWMVPVHSFLFWWVALGATGITASIVIGKLDSLRSKRLAEIKLSAPVMRFALCFASDREIHRFLRNHLPKHAEKADQYWKQFYPMLVSLLDPSDGRIIRHTLQMSTISAPDLDPSLESELIASGFGIGSGIQYRSIFPQIDMLRLAQPWFKLEQSTSKIVNAFNALAAKITGRMKDKKDLLSVANALKELTVFLYAAIPEISSDSEKKKKLDVLSERSLVRFAEIIQELPPYVPERRKLGQKEKATVKIADMLAWVAGLFAHENPLLKFILWWTLVQGLVLASVIAASHYVSSLKFDSTLVSLIIGTPLVVAAAALAAPARKKG